MINMKEYTYKVSDIQWSTDEEVELPLEVDITSNILLSDDDIVEALTNEYGFCIENLTYTVE